MDWIAVIAEVGFPIIVTLYLLLRIESRLEQLTASIQLLSERVVQRERPMPVPQPVTQREGSSLSDAYPLSERE